MHTQGTKSQRAKPAKAKADGDKRVAQGVATRAALLEAARALFGEHGYAATSTEDVVAKAGVTKGALYHHFTGKEDLFRAVYEEVCREVSSRAAELFLLPGSWDALVIGCNDWIDSHLDPATQRIALRDARAVLSWETVREIESRFAVVTLRGALRKAMNDKVIEQQPLRPLATLLIGALREGCLYIADADDTEAARDEVRALVLRLLTSLRAPEIEAAPARTTSRSRRASAPAAR